MTDIIDPEHDGPIEFVVGPDADGGDGTSVTCPRCGHVGVLRSLEAEPDDESPYVDSPGAGLLDLTDDQPEPNEPA